MKKTIYLTGFMGAGKTTIGRMLSGQLHIPVKDSDQEIEIQTGKTIRSIFDQDGEAYFRYLETKVLQTLPTNELIVTTGGGIILKEENREWMKNHGTLVYLHCDFDALWDRLKNDESRPLLVQQQKKQVEELYLSRLPLYQDHHFMVNTSSSKLEDIVANLAEKIKNKYN